MDLIKFYNEKLLNLEKMANEKYVYGSNEYKHIESYFKRINNGIKALEKNQFQDDTYKNFEINTINAHFKILEERIKEEKL